MKMNRIIFLSLLSLPLWSYESKSSTEHPNVVLIMADDVSWECFGAYGAEDYMTPNIDALAKDGLKFNHCYSTPLCTPSRVKIMTGKYNFRNYTHFGYLDPKEKTFGHLMQQAGYKTAIAGKWQLNGLYHNAEGCDDNTRPYKAGFDEYCLWQLTVPVEKKDVPNMTERFWSPLLEHNGKVLTVEDNMGKYGPDIMSDFVCDFIKRNQDSSFFIYYPSVLVHDPFVPTPDNIGSLPRTQAANLEPNEAAKKKENFVAMVNYLDKIVGKIVKQLDEVGQLENTIILFTADNGTLGKITSRWNGQAIKGGKGSTTDMGTHVPFIAYWKGHTKGQELNDLIDFTDFYATLAEASNITLNENDPIDGRSFLPQIRGETGKPREWQLNHYQPYWGNFKGEQYARNQEYKLYRDGRYYYIPNDLKEENSLAVESKQGEEERKKLNNVLMSMPPAPPVEGGNKVIERPVYPDWKNVVNPDD